MFKKEKKGCYKWYIDEESGVIVAIWNDNGPVTVGSNFETIKPLGTAKRWSKEDKDYICVPGPVMIGSYNKAMGGTDQMDQAISTYHLSTTGSGIGHFSGIAWRYLYTIHG